MSEYGLLLPFVVTESHGGPFDDEAYSAGWEMGQLFMSLTNSPQQRIGVTIRRENIPQADLLAMHAGWMLTEDPIPEGLDSVAVDSYEQWACVTFDRVTPE